jgi:beta-lactamase regulating signal transducer with metallopeptidase domain
MMQRGYEASYIWNCDESGAQAGKNGVTRVLAKTGVWNAHSIIPKEREWLSVFVCVNAAGFHIPSFYIFLGKSFQRDYIKNCEDNASMAMQPKAWMTGQLFKSWIGHSVIVVWAFHLLVATYLFLMATDLTLPQM